MSGIVIVKLQCNLILKCLTRVYFINVYEPYRGKSYSEPLLKAKQHYHVPAEIHFFCEGISLWMESHDKLPAEFILKEVM